MFTLNLKPIHVHVTDGRWDSYGSPTFWTFFLHTLLEKLGGISDSVLPGWYDFTIKREGFKFYGHLAPHKE